MVLYKAEPCHLIRRDMIRHAVARKRASDTLHVRVIDYLYVKIAS